MLLDDPQLREALQDLDEASRKAGFRRQSERLAKRLEQEMQKAFREQGRLFVSSLRTQLRRFFAEGFEGHAAFLTAALNESLLPGDWLPMWIEVSQRTIKMFTKPIEAAARVSMELGARSTISALDMKLSFDLSNPRAVSYLQEYGARQVTHINETTREYIQTLITQAVDEGWSTQRTAEALIERFQEFAIGQPQNHIDSRAHLIAVTETGNAYAQGNLLVAQELKAAGLEMQKAWSTVGDDKVTQGCLENEATGWIEVDQAFPSGHQRPLRFPGCRCDMKFRVKKEQ
jgi:hypothetical protein